jgi:hypothetical protein
VGRSGSSTVGHSSASLIEFSEQVGGLPAVRGPIDLERLGALTSTLRGKARG